MNEPLGFLCRWVLLGVCASGVAAMCWLGAIAGAGMPGEAGASGGAGVPAGAGASSGADASGWADAFVEIAPGDTVCSLAGQKVAVGLMGRDMAGPPTGVLLGTRPGGRQMLGWSQGPGYTLYIIDAQPGDNRIIIEGNPYGPVPYAAGRSRLLVVGPGEPIFLLDSSLVMPNLGSSGDARGAGGQPLGRAVERLDRRGLVAMVHPGPAGALARDRGRLEAAGIDLPTVASRSPNWDIPMTLLHLAEEVSQRPGDITFVTGDAGLAGRVSEKGFSIYLVGSKSGAGAKSGAGPFVRGRVFARFADLDGL